LAGLTNLQALALDGNQIRDLSPLKGLTNLKYLDLTNNPVGEQQIRELKEALPDIEIEY